MKPLILGAGGHAKNLLSLALSVKIQLSGYVAPISSENIELPYYGSDSDFLEKDSKPIEFICGFADLRTWGQRTALVEAYESKGHSFLTLIAPDVVNQSLFVGQGSQILNKALVQTHARIERHSVINSGAIIEHDCHIYDFVHVAPGALLCGGVNIMRGAFVGAGAIILPGLQIGEGATVGAGSVVTRDVPPGVTVVGNPARELEKL